MKKFMFALLVAVLSGFVSAQTGVIKDGTPTAVRGCEMQRSSAHSHSIINSQQKLSKNNKLIKPPHVTP